MGKSRSVSRLRRDIQDLAYIPRKGQRTSLYQASFDPGEKTVQFLDKIEKDAPELNVFANLKIWAAKGNNSDIVEESNLIIRDFEV